MSLAAAVALLGVALPLNLLSPFALLANEAAGMVIAAASNATGMMEGVIRIREYSWCDVRMTTRSIDNDLLSFCSEFLWSKYSLRV